MSETVEKKPSLRERKMLQTRQAILDAAEELFGSRGYNAVEVNDILEIVQVSQPTFYRYFETRAHLYLEVLAARGAPYNTTAVLTEILGEKSAGLLLANLRRA